MKLICPGCKNEFFPDSKRQKYCNRKCYDAHRPITKAVAMPCDHCKKSILVRPHKLNQQNHFCGEECRRNFRISKQIVQCTNCDKSIKRIPYMMQQNTTGLFFCNNVCKSKYYKRNYIVTCVICGKMFEKPPADQKRYPTHCCSKKCRAKNNDKRIKVECDQCEKCIFRPPSLLKGKKNIFCSEDCHNEFQDKKICIKCTKCGKEEYKSPVYVRRHRFHFCSTNCSSKYRYHKSFVESELEKLIIPLGIKYDRNNRSVLSHPDNKRRNPELDFWFPDIQYAIEVNGITHYKPIYGKSVFLSQKERDRYKRLRCKQLGITLRIVKPGNCRAGIYLNRYKTIIREIKKRMKS